MKVETLFLSRIKFLIFLLIICNNIECLSQKYTRGLLIEPEQESDVVRSPVLTLADYSNIPERFSLKEYAPVPGHQGQYSTCGAWATAYSARTISFILSNSIPAQNKSLFYFSPSFVYNQLKNDDNCASGISLKDALDILKFKGSLWLTEFQYSCDNTITEEHYKKAKQFSILEYREIFYRNDQLKVLKTKKSISEFKPVVIAMACPFSFENIKDIWIPSDEDYNNVKQNGHAVVVVGYDDQKYGGAFEILNSWGTEWAEGGFGWISYKDFDHFVYNGFELIEERNLDKDGIIAGSLSFKLFDNRLMKFEKLNGILVSSEKYPPQTKFEIFITNSTPVYLYCFSLDDENNFTFIFPQDTLTNNIFLYKNSTLPIPDEQHYLELDDKGREDYIFILLSKRQLSVMEIIFDNLQKRKPIHEILTSLLKNKPASYSLTVDTDNKIFFTSNSIKDNLLPIIIKIRKG